MIVDIPLEVQMAIRLRAVKNNCTTGEVVEAAVVYTYPEDIKEAAEVIQERKGKDS